MAGGAAQVAYHRGRADQALKAPESHAHWLMWLARIQANPAMKAQLQAYFRDHLLPRPPIEVVARAPEARGPAAAAK